MDDNQSGLVCLKCSQRFTHKSSLNRHVKRCSRGLKGPSRRKACGNCAAAKLRCDLQKPTCGRCDSERLACHYSSQNTPSVSQTEETPTAANIPRSRLQHAVSPEAEAYPEPRDAGCGDDTIGQQPPVINFTIPDKRRRQLLSVVPEHQITGAVAKSTMQLVIRNLKSWVRLMAVHDTAQLPPVVHPVQLATEVPIPLANCYALVKMWAGHTSSTTRLVRDTILAEIQRLLREHPQYGEMDLLATGQSLLFLMTVLFFCNSDSAGNRATDEPPEPEILISVWDVKHRIAQTGLYLESEIEHRMPRWHDWAVVSAKRRTISTLNQLEWAWSLLNGYPVLTCFELAPLPAPSTGYLWRETDKDRWRQQYANWLAVWKDGSFKMGELFYVNADDSLSLRAETWLAEADELGGLLMVEVNERNTGGTGTELKGCFE